MQEVSSTATPSLGIKPWRSTITTKGHLKWGWLAGPSVGRWVGRWVCWLIGVDLLVSFQGTQLPPKWFGAESVVWVRRGVPLTFTRTMGLNPQTTNPNHQLAEVPHFPSGWANKKTQTVCLPPTWSSQKVTTLRPWIQGVRHPFAGWFTKANRKERHTLWPPPILPHRSGGLLGIRNPSGRPLHVDLDNTQQWWLGFAASNQLKLPNGKPSHHYKKYKVFYLGPCYGPQMAEKYKHYTNPLCIEYGAQGPGGWMYAFLNCCLWSSNL